jgi:hypothetical protein
MNEERPARNAKCADCGHSFESHDYSGCLIWIDADAAQPCPCKVWKAANINPKDTANE